MRDVLIGVCLLAPLSGCWSLRGDFAPFDAMAETEAAVADEPAPDVAVPDEPAPDVAAPDVTAPGVPAPDVACAPGETRCPDGCRDLQSDPARCGACDLACVAPANSSPRCAIGRCDFSCRPGFGDCNARPADGCESDFARDPRNCGRCGNACSANNGAPSCVAGACAIACAPGFGDCDRDATNGCETRLDTVTNCGACRRPCPAPGGGVATCVAGVCGQTCPSGLTPCAGMCRNTQTDNAACGVCTNACRSTELCTAGVCRAIFCGAGVVACSAGGYCPANSACDPSGRACHCNPGYVGASCDGTACATCTFPNYRCVPQFCESSFVSCAGGGACPLHSTCLSGGYCTCNPGYHGATCAGAVCTSCGARDWHCVP